MQATNTSVDLQNYEHMWMYINGYNVNILNLLKKAICVTNLDVGGCEETFFYLTTI
jgi:hypothetical protein